MKILENILSLKNDGLYKVLNIFGLKLKFRNKYKALNLKFENQNKILEKKIVKLEQKNSELKQKIVKLEQKNSELEQKSAELDKQRKLHRHILTKRFEQFLSNRKYLHHTNRIINKIIDNLDDTELKQSQIKYLFTEIFKNKYIPNFNNPKSFNEKIQWLSLNYYPYHNEAKRVVDKLKFKEYIKEKLGDGYTVPLIGKWNSPYDIDYSMLPERFVLKSNWGGDSKQVKIIKDKSEINIDGLNREILQWLEFDGNGYYFAFNGAIKQLTPCIFAEEFIGEIETGLFDYKIYCFNAQPKIILVVKNSYDKDTPKTKTWYDINWNLLDLKRPSNAKHFDSPVPIPKKFSEMLRISKVLSKPFPFARIDFYETKDKLFVGEITLTPGGGLLDFNPVEWDYKFGELLDLSSLTKTEPLSCPNQIYNH